METRLGGLDNLQMENPSSTTEYVGPIELRLPNLFFESSFELSRPLQSFGILKMFNEGFSRQKFVEDLIVGEMWQRATFDSTAFKRNFQSFENGSWTPLKVSCDEPFLFLLKNNLSDVIHVFGYVRQHQVTML